MREETWRADLLRIVLRTSAVLGAIVYLPSVWLSLSLGMVGVAVMDTVAIGIILALNYFDRLPVKLRAVCACLVLYVLGAGLMIFVGAISQIYLFGSSLLCTLLVSSRWGFGTVVLNAVTMLAIGFVGIAAPEMVVPNWDRSSLEWTVITANFVFMNACLVLALGAVLGALESALERAKTARKEIERERVELVKLNESLALEVRERIRTEEAHEKLEAQLRQAQKMEAVGQLAGGVAHDFNNMLSVILGNAHLTLSSLAQDDVRREDMQEVVDAARRSADLTNQLLAFARQQPIIPAVLDLNEVVESSVSMLRRLIGEDVDLVWKPGAELHRIVMDSTQIHQILANLAVNARDSIAGVGKLVIETRNVSFDAAFCATHAGYAPGDYVQLSVSDSGAGMDKATLAKVFEPFFTTKEVGKGTGLGLAMVYGIVQQNGGLIHADSEPGQGATFRIQLRQCDGMGAVASQAPKSDSPPRGTETVLLVEDEEALLRVAARMLKGLGYTVITTTDPCEALTLASQHAEIDMLMTDVIMPHMTGRELWQELSKARPELKCLFISGYTADVISNRGVLEGGVQFLQKPFALDALARKVRHVLERAALTQCGSA
jgi:signal transduction histidine kinase/ActR/RegA family two-component response regulator